ncbi:MAG: enoyl-CoA hydratase/isomerase family protein [Deltaproteobacteria bacterium]|nr:enoyl-CoA hydratase/isomerase family protein [Deltaproteobacteria bacterium]MBW2046950.1 enoyl-CoA hydratase/isomerase family protein [Deltaproteobacteria bacterium]MBW2109891.1 enoyl-CoA hydratase/isomerase family protein [Deltaproteobacteria bacterium]MBW2352763.1 enoyl-CoA hydratase/isomerase family protein [Deltaproteobacteria bacterium]
MKKPKGLDQTHNFFSAKRIDHMVVLKFNENLLFSATDLKIKQPLFDYLDLISKIDDIKVVLLMGSPHKRGCEEYVEFYPRAFETEFGQYAIERLYNAVNQFILNIIALNKITVHADSGKVISLFLNISLACNYRVVADNTVFENPCLRLGLVPKGGGAFFLPKMLGASRALEILLSEEDISAQKALELGLVDRLVPTDELEDAAMETARAFARKPGTTLSGLKRLLSYSMKDLEGFLRLENEVLLKIGTSQEFQKRLRECAPDNL